MNRIQEIEWLLMNCRSNKKLTLKLGKLLRMSDDEYERERDFVEEKAARWAQDGWENGNED